MDKLKQALSLFFALSLALLAGCSATPDYPVWEADITGLSLRTGTASQYTFSYVDTLWVAEPEVGNRVALVYTQNTDENQICNISIQLDRAHDKPVTEQDLQTLTDSMGDSFSYFTIDRSEMRLVEDTPVILLETTSRFTDEYLDMAIEQGILTEEMIEASGGRELFHAMPPTTQITAIAVCDGLQFTLTGSYYNATQKQDLETQLVLLLNTLDSL